MTQKIRAINIANNTFKNFVFDSTVSSLINTAAVAYSTANAANALAQAANTVVVSQASQAVAPTINTISITDSSYNVIDDTAANTGGAYLRITGSGFQTGATVLVGSSNTALSTTFVNSSTLRSQIGPISSGTYPVYVVNTNGGTAIRLNGLTISSSPVWGTGSTLANVISNTAFSGTLSANSDSSVTYANTTILPTGFNLASNGYYYGNISIGAITTYSFDIKATDAELQDQTRTFSLTTVISNAVSSVEYLVVAGGGGGGATRGGGGGAGGLLTGLTPVTPGVLYTITVGSGGSGANFSPATGSSNGSSSIFSSITTVGGGRGSSRQGAHSAGSGGSGGGGGSDYNLGSPGTPGQGYPGGNAFGGAYAGGGGGAGAAGANGTDSPEKGGNGGNGISSSMSGSTLTYAGGGGGGTMPGSATAGTGGSGGGGNGGGISGGSYQVGGNGTTNSGGGGGGGGDDKSGGSGGSGIVIINYPTAYAAATSATGSITVSNETRRYIFTSSGTITF